MSESYTKLFNSIVTSTIVSEPVATRWLWVTMLAESDSNGCVWASIPGLARVANLTIAEVEEGLKCFSSPDPYSRTKDYEGRRIEEVDGGWLILNHAKYRAKLSKEERKDYKREWDRKYRAKQFGEDESDSFRQNPTASDTTRQNPTNPTHTDTDTDTDTKAEQEQNQKHVPETSFPPSADADHAEPKVPLAKGFPEFWQKYPRDENKAAALKAWKAKRISEKPDLVIRILDDIGKRVRLHRPWLEGYIPHASTYLNGKRWEDQITTNDQPARTGLRSVESANADAVREALRRSREKQSKIIDGEVIRNA